MALKSNSDERKIVDLNNFEKAQSLLNATMSGKYRVILYGGAVRGGKSFNILAMMVLLLRQYPGARAVIVRDSLETLKRNTLPTCKKVFPPRFMELSNATSFIWNCNNHYQRYGGHEHRSSIFFFGENFDRDKDLQRWDGLEVNYIMLDQIEELKEKTFNKAIERAGSYVIPGIPIDKQPVPIIFASCNPTKNWVKRLIYNRYINGTLPHNWLYIPATIHDNPHIPEGYKESLEQLKFTNPEEYKRRVEGDWDYLDGDNHLFDSDALEDMFTNDWPQIGEGGRYMTADIAMQGADKFVVGIWKGWRLEYIYTYDKSNGPQIVNTLRQLARRHRIPHRNIAYDAVGVGDFLTGFLRTGFAFKGNARPLPLRGARKKGKAKDPPPNYENLRAQCYYMLARKVEEYQIFVKTDQATQEKIIEECEANRTKDKDKLGPLKIIPKEEVKEILGRSPDYPDMMSMRVVFDLVKKKKPTTTVH